MRISVVLVLILSYNAYAEVDPPRGFSNFCFREQTSPMCDGSLFKTDKVPTHEDIEAVNDKINSSVRYVKDIKRIGLPEWWEVAEDSGDCEDFALRKAKELVDRGFNIENIRLATVWHFQGDGSRGGHAILVVKDDNGDEWVLDNIYKKLLSPDDSGYQFKAIQKVGGSRHWVDYK